MSKKFSRYFFLLLDWVTAIISWGCFFLVRKEFIEHEEFHVDLNFYYGILFIPFLWLIIYLLQGTYHDVRRLYRLKTFNMTFLASFIGTIILFFVFILDDEVEYYKEFYKSFIYLFLIHFSITFFVRIVYVSLIVDSVHKNKLGFNTLLIGGGVKSLDIYNEIKNLPKGIGTDFVGFLSLSKNVSPKLEEEMINLGGLNDLERILVQNRIEEVIIALEERDYDQLKTIVSRIERSDVKIKISPELYDVLFGSVKMTNIFGALLCEVNTDAMPVGQRIIKRVFDFVFSFLAIIALIPFYLVMALVVMSSSEGPIFFLQERIGLYGKKFNIIKFRTMFINAENNGPQLSSSEDPRITKFGRFMRKLRLDEFPQFFNVLRGDMSLVGPRPERQFYIDQIVKIEPQFLQLNKVRPGITSWGQVKFGYAENIDQMIQRMKFDLLYINNRSLSLDFKIMIYTIFIILKAKGK